MITLGIETSCDETALALIESRVQDDHFECRVINSLVHSQAQLHSAYGGVFPNLAKREHGKTLIPLLHKLLIESKEIFDAIATKATNTSAGKKPAERRLSEEVYLKVIDSFSAELTKTNPDLIESLKGTDFLKKIPPIDEIAVTEGPGLEPALWVGINFARILGALWEVPIIPINHMEGHIVGSLLKADSPYGTWQELKNAPLPSVALLISGGHTELIGISDKNDHYEEISTSKIDYSILGQTVDDAVGEAFDKVARLLGLPYPGGPHISKMARDANELGIISPIKLPRPMINSGDLNFSFAGLKTAVLYAVQKADKTNQLDDTFKKGLAREFEQAVADVLDFKLRKAVEAIGARSIIVGGGVSANIFLRDRLTQTAAKYDIPIFLPSRHISGDNALMIALAATLRGGTDTYDHILRAQGTKRLA